MFGHRQFLSSFWILEITRFTVSSIRSSLGLLVRGLFVRPHRGLVSGFDWLFFMRFTPVQQSSQEYLGVLVHDPVRWILENILKGNPDGVGLIWITWGSDFWTYWTYSRNSMTSWVQWLQRHIQSEKLTEPIVSPLKLGKWGGQSDIPFTHTIGVFQIHVSSSST